MLLKEKERRLIWRSIPHRETMTLWAWIFWVRDCRPSSQGQWMFWVHVVDCISMCLFLDTNFPAFILNLQPLLLYPFKVLGWLGFVQTWDTQKTAGLSTLQCLWVSTRNTRAWNTNISWQKQRFPADVLSPGYPSMLEASHGISWHPCWNWLKTGI